MLVDAGRANLYIGEASYLLIRLVAEAAHPSTWGCKTSWQVFISATTFRTTTPYAPQPRGQDTRGWLRTFVFRASMASEESEHVFPSPALLRRKDINITGAVGGGNA